MEFRAKPEGIHLNGKRLNIRAANWFGCETPDYTFHGLWQVSWKSLLDFLCAEGYNLIRVPLSIELMEGLDTLQPKTINYSANADLRGKTAGAILDIIFADCARRGILVLPDVHRNAASDGITPLWYDDAAGYTETRLINAWVKFLNRYKGNPYVFAADLRNEPHGQATWGGAPETDWHAAATRIGNAVLKTHPHLLIFVEGVEKRNKPFAYGAYWGSVLDSVRERPVVLDLPERVVYSPHYYGPSVHRMDYHSDMDANVPKVMENDFGYIAREGLGCVFIGELGGRCVGEDARWHEAAAKYIEGNPGLQASVAVWALNPNSGDTGGLLKDDWVTPESHKLPYYRRMSLNSTLLGSPPLTAPVAVQPKPEPPAEPPVVAPTPVKLTVTKKETWPEGENTMTKYELEVFNSSTSATKPVVSLTGGLATQAWCCTPLPMEAQGSLQRFALPIWSKGVEPQTRWQLGMIVASKGSAAPQFTVG